MKALLAVLFLAGSRAAADTTVSGDFQVTGQVGVGTLVPQARLEARMSASDAYGLKVSSFNGTILATLDSAGRFGIGTLYPQARLDVRGSGDDRSVGMWIRAGNSTSTLSSAQLAFGLSSTDTYRQSIRTRHNLSEHHLNSIDFYLWNSTSTPSTLGSLDVMSIQGSFALSSASVHIMPVGEADAELEVSNGSQIGQGRMRYVSSGVHVSKRAFKFDIAPLSDQEILRAYEDVKALRPAKFRYKSAKPGNLPGPETRGLIYEDSPESIRGYGKAVIFDYRLANLEMALKVVNKRIEEINARIAEAEKHPR